MNNGGVVLLPVIVAYFDLSSDFLRAVRRVAWWRRFRDRTGWRWVAKVYRRRHRAAQVSFDALMAHVTRMEQWNFGGMASVLVEMTCREACGEWTYDDNGVLSGKEAE